MGINKKKFIEGFTSLGNEKGISNENLQQILADSFNTFKRFRHWNFIDFKWNKYIYN